MTGLQPCGVEYSESEFPLSFAQERLWFHDQLSPGDPSVIITSTVRLTRPISPAALEAAVDAVVARHESLRTRFTDRDGTPLQSVASTLHIPLRVVDLRDTPGPRREVVAARLVEQAATEPFDLRALPLLRAALFVLGDADALFCLTMHHIVADGWSLDIFFRDMNAYLAGTPEQLPELEIGYPDFAAWQRGRSGDPAAAADLEWWATSLAGAEVLDVPTDHPRRPGAPRDAGRVPFTVPAVVAQAVLARGRRHGCTPFMTMLAAFAALMARYADQDDFVLGTYTAGRDRPELEQLIGFFINALPLRLDLTGAPNFATLLTRTRAAVLNAFARQDVPYAGIVERIGPPRESTRNPLFDVVLHFYNVPGSDVGPAVDDHRGAAPLDLVCSMWESKGELHGHLDYRTALFEPQTIEALLRCFQTVLGQLADGADGPVSELDLLSDTDWRGETVDANRTDRPEPAASLIDLFEMQAAATPDAVAFRYRGSELSYRALRNAGRQLAARLAGAGAGPGRIVGVHLSRTLELPIGILGVLYAGAAFLPLDVTQPLTRVAGMLADAGALLMVSCEAQFPGIETVSVRSPGDGDAELRPTGTRPDDLAYVIFTSGSTGRPKGVAVAHRQIRNRLQWMWDEYPFQPGEVACQKTAIGFVDAIWELFGALLRGVPTVIVPDDVVRDPALLVDTLAAHQVSRIWLVPSLLRELLEAVPDVATRAPALRFWVLSGEPFPRSLCARFRAVLPRARIFNLYGTSEVWDATWYDASAEDSDLGQVPIGGPIANVQAYVLDKGLRPIPRGAVGELVIGGAGVARGYLRLTSAAFVADPFHPEGQLYRTGDLARRRADGSLELRGRRDLQVKLRGFRVEPEEVEAVLLGHPSVVDAAVVVQPGPGDQPMLVAFLTGGPDLAAVRAFAALRLPEHLRPARWSLLDALPVTASGKVDRSRLPIVLSSTSVAPRTQTALERVIAEVWSSVLDVDGIGADDDFFVDLGGHSLLAMRALSRLRRLLGMDLLVGWMFEAPTVAGLATLIEDRVGREVSEQIAALVLEVTGMSDAEAEAALAQMRTPG